MDAIYGYIHSRKSLALQPCLQGGSPSTHQPTASGNISASQAITEARMCVSVAAVIVGRAGLSALNEMACRVRVKMGIGPAVSGLGPFKNEILSAHVSALQRKGFLRVKMDYRYGPGFFLPAA